ncbi:hypothetical protein [Jejuia pallidilutea]|uniref:Uncharacterized protein n=1 Tax=Jejuia pallidilutea TaxID=504487 RepID=A0A090W7H2_9FLAO|nr:hypothetical protein [Jejuia pallidilutea]GAL72955.1 hypothetical protein JCM19302_4249 [Jejuia pallidilutea]GAL89979.1 hypothetical protein JCM19538_2810 [Jejuia pallidilutea]
MKKTVFTILVIILSNLNCFAQFKNYQIRNEKVNCETSLSDISILKIDEVALDRALFKSNEDSLSMSSELTSFLIGKVAKIPEYITQYLQKRKLKFTANYEAKNTLTFTSSKKCLPKLTFERYFFKRNKEKERALSLVLQPELVQEDKYLAFKVHSLSYNFSKAKLKKKASRINLLVELTLVYAKNTKEPNILEKTESKSAAIIIPASLRDESQDISIINTKFSDVFIAENILEISLKITEINPYKLKLEDLESFLITNKEDLSGLFGELSKLLK